MNLENPVIAHAPGQTAWMPAYVGMTVESAWAGEERVPALQSRHSMMRISEFSPQSERPFLAILGEEPSPRFPSSLHTRQRLNKINALWQLKGEQCFFHNNITLNVHKSQTGRVAERVGGPGLENVERLLTDLDIQ